MQPDQFPQSILDELNRLDGFDPMHFGAALQMPAPVAVRLNPSKPTEHNLPLDTQINGCQGAYLLSQKPNFGLDPLWHAGAYYVQEASSMVLDYVVRTCIPSEAPPQLALDLCAAPGGKTTILTDALPAQSLVIANEIIRSRNAVLVENMARWGSAYLAVTQNEAAHWGEKFAGVFDVLLVDAPCSGSGMFRKSEAARTEWSEKNIIFCALRQKEILLEATPILAENGLLIYSTCSYSKAENEDIADFLIGELGFLPVDLPVPPGSTLLKTYSDKHKAAGFRLMPGYSMGEGLYMACFKNTKIFTNKKTEKQTLKFIKPDFINNDWATIPADLQIYRMGDYLHLLPERYAAFLAGLGQKTYMRKAGTGLGIMAGKDFIPGAEFALLAGIKAGDWQKPVVELSYSEAIEYLKGLPPAPNPDYKGWQLIAYQNLVLGWAKALGTRSNNYYPSAWYIRKG